MFSRFCHLLSDITLDCLNSTKDKDKDKDKDNDKDKEKEKDKQYLLSILHQVLFSFSFPLNFLAEMQKLN